MSKILSPFERHLKEKMSDFEAPYEPQNWYAVKNALYGTKTNNYGWVVALVSALLVTGGGSYAIYQNQHSNSKAMVMVNSPRFAKPQTASPVSMSELGQIESPLLVAANESAYSTSLLNSTQALAPNTKLADIKPSNSNAAINQVDETHRPDSQTLLNESNSKVVTSPLKPENIIGFESNIRQACEGAEVDFNVTNGPKNGSYLWNFGDGHFSADPNPKHKYSKSGNYDVSLSITSEKGQINTKVVSDMITINPAPDANFRWEFINDDPNAPSIKIVNTSEDGNSYEWIFNDGNSSSQESPIIPVDVKGKKMIALTAKNDYGCTDGAVKQISINTDFALSASPSLNIGEETFMPSGLKQSNAKFVMSIYNTSGTKVYETSNRLKGWDGKVNGGDMAKSGEKFFWKIIITNDITHEQKYFNGILTVSP